MHEGGRDGGRYRVLEVADKGALAGQQQSALGAGCSVLILLRRKRVNGSGRTGDVGWLDTPEALTAC